MNRAQWLWPELDPDPDSPGTEENNEGYARFLTQVDVTGGLSLDAARAAAYRFACVVALSRLNIQSLEEAFESLSDIHAWQCSRADKKAKLPPERKSVVVSPAVKHTKRKPFVFDED